MERKTLISLITNRQGANYFERKGLLNNGRKLNRLSTKQLIARNRNQQSRLNKRMMQYAEYLSQERSSWYVSVKEGIKAREQELANLHPEWNTMEIKNAVYAERTR